MFVGKARSLPKSGASERFSISLSFSLHPGLFLHLYLSVCLYLSPNSCFCLFFSLSICLSLSISQLLSLSLSAYLSVCLSPSLNSCLCLSLCLSLSLPYSLSHNVKRVTSPRSVLIRLIASPRILDSTENTCQQQTRQLILRTGELHRKKSFITSASETALQPGLRWKRKTKNL
jgi:hypothetical protein